MTTTLDRVGRARFLVPLVFVLLLLYRPQAVLYPPYWDSILGFFHEAIWLLENQFDFRELALGQEGYIAGGPRIYLFSLMPSAIAILMKIMPNATSVFVVMHLLIYLCAGGVVYLTYKLLLPKVGAKLAMIAAGTLLVQPLFVSQSYQLNSEILLTFLWLLALHAYLREHHVAAASWMVLSSFIKQPTMLIAIGMAVVYLFGRARKPKQFGIVLLYLLPFILMNVRTQLILPLLNNNSNDVVLSGMDWRQFLQLWYIKQQVLGMVRVVPDLFAAFVVVPAVALIMLAKTYFQDRSNLFSFIKQHEMALILLFAVCLFMLKSATLISWIPRYMIYLLPAVFILLAIALNHAPAKLTVGIFSAIIAWGVLNQFGALYAKVVPNNGYALERTLEYEADLELNQALASKVEEHHAGQTIVTHWPLTHLFTKPAFGYVKNPLSVVALNRPALAWSGVPLFTDLPLAQRRSPESRWVISQNLFVGLTGIDPEKHALVDTVSVNGRSATIWNKAEKPERDE